MRIREDDIKIIRTNDILGFNCDEKGVVTPDHFLKTIYPPIGFLPWNVLEVGNGDVYGFYWPLGKENTHPLVCTTYHDSYNLSVFASNIETSIKRLWVNFKFNSDEEDDEDSIIREELSEIAKVFSIDLEEVSEVKTESSLDLLKIDSNSPDILLKASQEYIKRNELSKAENCLVRALEIIPEYTQASFELSKLYRRQREEMKALEHMILTCISPICFGGLKPRQQCLQWIKSMNDNIRSLVSDPFLNFVDSLTFKSGEKFNDDFTIYEQLIEQYIQIGEFRKALSLRVLAAELITIETTAFQERYNWNYDTFFDKLRSQLKISGYSATEAILNKE
jgi:tetratricopeptide (TPR) repeat protein